MGEISNKTLAILVIVAIIVSVVGLFIGRAKIVTVGQAEEGIGVIKAALAADIQLVVEGGPIDFGNVIIGDTNDSLADLNQVLLVGSIGATPTYITYWADSPTGPSTDGSLFRFLEDTPGSPNDGSTADSAFQIAIVNEATTDTTVSSGNIVNAYNPGDLDDCTGGLSDDDGSGNAFTAYGVYQNVIYDDDGAPSSSVRGIAKNCRASVGSTRQGFGVKIKIIIPLNEPSESKQATLNFKAVEYGSQT